MVMDRNLTIDLGAIPGEVLTVYRGDIVRVVGKYYYSGPALSGLKFKAIIGTRGTLRFDPIIWKEIEFTQASTTGEDFTIAAEIPITKDISDGLYDLYCKISNIPDLLGRELISEDVSDCIRVIAAAEFRNLKVVSFEKVE